MKSKKVLSIILIFAVVLSFSHLAFSYRQYRYESISALSKLGSRGEEVRRVQKKLKQLGYYKGSVDGIYGSATQRAVRAFQKNCGITADGIAGPKTWAEI